MATKQLDLIATKAVRNYKPVMPRIYCKDGVSLSVQASSQHYSPTKATPALRRANDEGPWIALKSATLSCPVPTNGATTSLKTTGPHSRNTTVEASRRHRQPDLVHRRRGTSEFHRGSRRRSGRWRTLCFQSPRQVRRTTPGNGRGGGDLGRIALSLTSARPDIQQMAIQALAFDYYQSTAVVRKLEGEWRALWKEAEIHQCSRTQQARDGGAESGQVVRQCGRVSDPCTLNRYQRHRRGNDRRQMPGTPGTSPDRQVRRTTYFSARLG